MEENEVRQPLGCIDRCAQHVIALCLRGRFREMSETLPRLRDGFLPRGCILGNRSKLAVDVRSQRRNRPGVVAHLHDAAGTEASAYKVEYLPLDCVGGHINHPDHVDEVKLSKIPGLEVEQVATQDFHARTIRSELLARNAGRDSGYIRAHKATAQLIPGLQQLCSGSATYVEDVRRPADAAERRCLTEDPANIRHRLRKRVVDERVVILRDRGVERPHSFIVHLRSRML